MSQTMRHKRPSATIPTRVTGDDWPRRRPDRSLVSLGLFRDCSGVPPWGSTRVLVSPENLSENAGSQNQEKGPAIIVSPPSRRESAPDQVSLFDSVRIGPGLILCLATLIMQRNSLRSIWFRVFLGPTVLGSLASGSLGHEKMVNGSEKPAQLAVY
jgi:hypothetical protein